MRAILFPDSLSETEKKQAWVRDFHYAPLVIRAANTLNETTGK